MYLGEVVVDGVELHRLARRLTDLARAATTAGPWTGLTAGQLAVLEDLLHHPGSVGQDIAARTGFVQSHVSASVTRLRDRGLVTTSPDPDDRRRTTVTLTGPARRAILARAARPVIEVLAGQLPEPDQASRALELLEELNALLIPERD